MENEIVLKEEYYRNISIAAGAVIAVFWAAMICVLVFGKILPEYRRENAIDYSQLFHKDRIYGYSSMSIYLDREYLGYTKTIITDTPDEGRLIRGETSISLSLPVVSGRFNMDTRIYVSAEQALSHFLFEITSPVPEIGSLRVKGVRDGDMLRVEIPALSYEREFPFNDEMIASSISPFSEIMRLKTGMQWDITMFDPFQGAFRTMTVHVVSREDITWMDKTESVYKLECRNERGSLLATAWADRNGRILKETVNFLGMTLRFERYD